MARNTASSVATTPFSAAAARKRYSDSIFENNCWRAREINSGGNVLQFVGLPIVFEQPLQAAFEFAARDFQIAHSRERALRDIAQKTAAEKSHRRGEQQNDRAPKKQRMADEREHEKSAPARRAKRASGREAEWTGLEPATSGVTGRYSNQLNYHSRTLAKKSVGAVGIEPTASAL